MHFSKHHLIVVAILFGATVATNARGDAIHSSSQPIGYMTTGDIGTSGITGTNVVSFTG